MLIAERTLYNHGPYKQQRKSKSQEPYSLKQNIFVGRHNQNLISKVLFFGCCSQSCHKKFSNAKKMSIPIIILENLHQQLCETLRFFVKHFFTKLYISIRLSKQNSSFGRFSGIYTQAVFRFLV